MFLCPVCKQANFRIVSHLTTWAIRRIRFNIYGAWSVDAAIHRKQSIDSTYIRNLIFSLFFFLDNTTWKIIHWNRLRPARSGSFHAIRPFIHLAIYQSIEERYFICVNVCTGLLATIRGASDMNVGRSTLNKWTLNIIRTLRWSRVDTTNTRQRAIHLTHSKLLENRKFVFIFSYRMVETFAAAKSENGCPTNWFRKNFFCDD